MSEDQVRIRVGKEIFTLSLEDAGQLHDALLDALATSQLEGKELLQSELADAEAMLDADGSMRIGTWLLGPMHGSLTLSRRQRTGRFFLVHIAQLEKSADNEWSVAGIRQEYLPLTE